MTGMRLAVVALALMLTGCGGGGDATDGAEPHPSTGTPHLTPSATAPPSYVETDTCRAGMSPLLDVMLANAEAHLEFNVFDNRVKQLQKGIDSALAPCSSAVSDPAREVMYNFIAADARWLHCAKGPCVDAITTFITDGLGKAKLVKLKVDLTA